MYIEQYAPKLFYLQGNLNVLAGTFSCLPRFDSLEIMEGKSLETKTQSLPLQDPTSVMDLYTNTEESELPYLSASSIYQRWVTITIQQNTC